MNAPYDKIADSWDGIRHTFFRRERDYLATILEGLPAGSRILDLGCGTGRPMAEHVLASGHHVVGVDGSRELLAKARERFPQSTWIESRVETFVPEGEFAAAIAWDVLFHLPRELHEGILRRLAKWLRPRARLMLTSGGSAHPPFTDEMFGQTFYYDSLPPDELRALLPRCGFTILIDEFINPPTDGRDKGRLAIVAEKDAGQTALK